MNPLRQLFAPSPKMNFTFDVQLLRQQLRAATATQRLQLQQQQVLWRQVLPLSPMLLVYSLYDAGIGS